MANELRDWENAREEAKIKATKIKAKWRIGLFLNLLVAAVYLYILWGTDLIRALWVDRAGNGFLYLVQICLPLVGVTLVLGFISVIFLKKSSSVSGFLLSVAMVITQSIAICIWDGTVGFLAHILFIVIMLNIISAFPGFVVVSRCVTSRKNSVLHEGLKELAKQGDPVSQYEYALLCSGDEQREWLNKAFAQGYEAAKKKLVEIQENEVRERNMLYHKGIQIMNKKGGYYAKKWFEKAAKQGHPGAKDKLKEIERDAEAQVARAAAEREEREKAEAARLVAMPKCPRCGGPIEQQYVSQFWGMRYFHATYAPDCNWKDGEFPSDPPYQPR